MAGELLRRERMRFAQGISQGVDVDRVYTAEQQRQFAVLRYKRDCSIMRERLFLRINHRSIQNIPCFGRYPLLRTRSVLCRRKRKPADGLCWTAMI